MSNSALKRRVKLQTKSSKNIPDHKSPQQIEHQNNNNNSINYFQSFIYNDHITNNKLQLQKSMFDKQNKQNINYGSSQLLLKSTKRFHLKSLKNKNYKIKNKNDVSVEIRDQVHGSPQCDRIQKYLVRRKISRDRYSREKRQLGYLLSRDRSYLYASANVSLERSRRQSFKHYQQRQDIDYTQQSINPSQIPITQLKKTNRQQPHHHNQQVNSHQQTQYKQRLKHLTKKLQNSQQKQKLGQLELELNVEVGIEIEQQMGRQKQNVIKKQKKKTNFGKLIPDTLNYDMLNQSEKQIIGKLDQQLRREVIKNSEYLIIPDLAKVKRVHKMRTTPGNGLRMQHIVANPIFKQKHQKSKKLIQNNENAGLKKVSFGQQVQKKQKQHKKTQKQDQQIQHYKFKIEQLKSLARSFDPKLQIPSSPPSSPRTTPPHPIFQSIQNDKYFRIEIQLSTNPSLLQLKDQKNRNNLLHVCIINNKVQIFKMIIIKCKQNGINLLQQPNKYGKTPLDLIQPYSCFYSHCQNDVAHVLDFFKWHHL